MDQLRLGLAVKLAFATSVALVGSGCGLLKQKDAIDPNLAAVIQGFHMMRTSSSLR